MSKNIPPRHESAFISLRALLIGISKEGMRRPPRLQMGCRGVWIAIDHRSTPHYHKLSAVVQGVRDVCGAKSKMWACLSAGCVDGSCLDDMGLGAPRAARQGGPLPLFSSTIRPGSLFLSDCRTRLLICPLCLLVFQYINYCTQMVGI